MDDKPVLTCCEPVRGWFPSGRHWAHSRDCAVEPGQRARDKARREASKKAHPAGKGEGWGA